MAQESKTLWLHRPLINWMDVYEWAEASGIKKLLPPEQLHITLATCRTPVDWSSIVVQTDTLTIPEGHKVVQIFGYIAKAIAFGHPAIKERHTELSSLLPTMDHADILRPHLTLMRGGKMPKDAYLGKLVFGPEVLQEFNPQAVKTIKHSLVRDILVDARADSATPVL